MSKSPVPDVNAIGNSSLTSSVDGEHQASLSDEHTTLASGVITYGQGGVGEPSNVSEKLRPGPGLSRAEQQKMVQDKMEPGGDKHSEPSGVATKRRVMLMRHAERLDRVFPDWLRLAYGYGKYQPHDLNQPLQLMDRPSDHYENDTPITEIGYVCAQMVGRALAMCRVAPTNVYCSPALRCVQTAHSLLKALENKNNQQLDVAIEPGLFEWMGWYKQDTLKWFTPEQLKEAGYRIDSEYKPMITQIKEDETIEEHYKRYDNVLRQILDKHQQPSSILVVGHATTVDACGRALLEKTYDTRNKLENIGTSYPYCALLSLEELVGGTWRIDRSNGLPPITGIGFSSRIDQTFLNR